MGAGGRPPTRRSLAASRGAAALYQHPVGRDGLYAPPPAGAPRLDPYRGCTRSTDGGRARGPSWAADAVDRRGDGASHLAAPARPSRGVPGRVVAAGALPHWGRWRCRRGPWWPVCCCAGRSRRWRPPLWAAGPQRQWWGLLLAATRATARLLFPFPTARPPIALRVPVATSSRLRSVSGVGRASWRRCTGGEWGRGRG